MKVPELFNRERRIITYLCKELNYTRKKFKKQIKRDREFRQTLYELLTNAGIETKDISFIKIKKETQNEIRNQRTSM